VLQGLGEQALDSGGVDDRVLPARPALEQVRQRRPSDPLVLVVAPHQRSLPDGFPLWVSEVRPGREHDTTCSKAATDLLPALEAVHTECRIPTLTDLGHIGISPTVRHLGCDVFRGAHCDVLI